MEQGENRGQEILTAISKEKFRRCLLIVSRALAVALILAIVWVGYVQMNYAKEVEMIKGEYGSLGYCYMCGLEAMRSCSCVYLTSYLGQDPEFTKEEFAETMAETNIMACEAEKPRVDDKIDLSSLNKNITINQ